ncbi:hypothetical protein D3C78_1643160 [compost metagenome]
MWVPMASTTSMVRKSALVMFISPAFTPKPAMASPSAMKWRFLVGALTRFTIISANFGWASVGRHHSWL